MDDETFEEGDGSVAVDLSGVEEATFENIPRGKYGCTVETCEYTLSQASGQPMWALQLVINDGEYEGRKLFDNVSFSPKALPFTKKKLQFLAPELLGGPFNPETTASDIEGKTVTVEVKMEKYEGEMRSRVKGFVASGAGDGGAFV